MYSKYFYEKNPYPIYEIKRKENKKNNYFRCFNSDFYEPSYFINPNITEQVNLFVCQDRQSDENEELNNNFNNNNNNNPISANVLSKNLNDNLNIKINKKNFFNNNIKKSINNNNYNINN